MSKTTKDIAVASSADSEKVVYKPIENDKKEERVAKLLPLGFFGGMTAVVLGMGFAVGVPLADVVSMVPLITTAMAIGGGFVTKLSLRDVRETSIKKALSLTGSGFHSLKMERNEAGHKSAFVASFDIKEKGELDIDAWVDPKNKVAPGEATHTIYQSLVKTKNGYLIEQRIAPNSEAIWDMSADALVEVYGIQEKTESMRELTT